MVVLGEKDRQFSCLIVLSIGTDNAIRQAFILFYLKTAGYVIIVYLLFTDGIHSDESVLMPNKF